MYLYFTRNCKSIIEDATNNKLVSALIHFETWIEAAHCLWRYVMN